MSPSTRDPPPEPRTVHVRVLGGLEVFVDGSEASGFLARRLQAAVLAYLAVERSATRDRLTALLWPDSDDSSARHSLSQVLYELKGTFGPSWLQAAGDRLRATDRVEADTVEFMDAVGRKALDEALSLYRGSFLEGVYLRDTVAFEQWVDAWRLRLKTLFQNACRERVGQCLARGDRSRAVAVAHRCAQDDPLDPDAQLPLLELLIESGDHLGALRQYERYARRLRAEDMEPPAKIARMMDGIAPEDEARAEAPAAGSAGTRPSLTGASTLPRIVVLPFEHLGEPGGEHFADGMTDEVTNRLAQLSELAIIARTSANQYRNSTKTVEQIRRELGVDYVLEGTVRWDDSTGERRVRVSPQLIRAADSAHVWAEMYEATLGEVFRVQSAIAERVAEVLEIRLRPPEQKSLARRAPQDPDAHELYVRGKRQWEESVDGALERAMDLFRRSIEIDPSYARAYAGLAETYALIPSFRVTTSAGWLSKAKAAAERALELDPSCAEAHVAAGMVEYLLACDMEAAEARLHRALELAPSSSTAHTFLSYVRCATDRPKEALESMARAHALDPLSVTTNFNFGFLAWQARDRDLALRQLRLVTQLTPEFDPALYVVGGIQMHGGDPDAAAREWASLSMFGPPWQTFLRVLDDGGRAIDVVDRMVELAPGSVHWYGLSSLYTLLCAEDRAFWILESHCDNLGGRPTDLATSGPSLAHLKTDPFFDHLRSHRRYHGLLEQIGLT